MNWNQALFPSLKRRGGCAIKKMSRSNLSSRRRGGAKRKPDRAQPQEKIGEIFRPEEFRRTDHPVCGASEASRLFINAAATPPLQGGECVRTETVCQFIHTFSALGGRSYGSVKAVIESSVSGESRKPPAADVMTTYCLPF